MIRYAALLLLFVALLPLSAAEKSAPTATPAASAKTETSPPAADKPEKQLPAEFDLRPQMQSWGLVPRHQGHRNTCSVFTTTAALEFAASKHYDHGTRLSVEYLNWACNDIINNHTQDRGQFFNDLLNGYQKHGVCTEDLLAYTKSFDPALEPSADANKSAEKIRDLGLKVHWLKRWRQTPGLMDWRLKEIKGVIVSGYPVASGASHSRLLVGYKDDDTQPGGGIFYTQDSGLGKFSTVTYQFAKDNMNDLFWIEAP